MKGTNRNYRADVIIIGGGLAGIVTAAELLNLGKQVLILERDTEDKFGGLCKEAFGGMCIVDTPVQRRLGIKDNPELALSDWLRVAQFDSEDVWPRRWAEIYVNRTRDLVYDWMVKRKIKFLPLPAWTERGVFKTHNSVPRWHVIWGTGSGVIEAILKHIDAHPNRKNLTVQFGHQVNRLEYSNGAVVGCHGVLEGSDEEFSAMGSAVVAAAGGVGGGDMSFIRKHWYKPWGSAPENLLNGSHRFGDGKIHECVAEIGGNVTHLDKNWLYAHAIHYPATDTKVINKGLSLAPPRSALWMNAKGRRIMAPVPLSSYTDGRYLVESILKEPGQYSWMIMNWKIAKKEMAASASKDMKAFRQQDFVKLFKDMLFGNTELVERLIRTSKDIVTADSMDELVEKMNSTDSEYKVDGEVLKADIKAYDDQIDRGKRYYNDDQLRRIANFRTYKADRMRVCNFQKIDDPKARPLIAARLFLMTRKSLGGVQTDDACRVLSKNGEVLPGLYSVGENAGFGGGGIHGKGSLEGTFLGACVLTGRIAAHAICNRKL